MVTVYGTVVEVEAVEAPLPPGTVPPEIPPDPPPPKTWVHIHVRLDAPHTGELQIDAPQSAASVGLVMGGRARVMVASN